MHCWCNAESITPRMSYPWRRGYQSNWSEGQTDTPCFRHLLLPLSAGYWPLLNLLFLAWSAVLPRILLQGNKINSLFKVAKNPFNHQSILLISHSAFIYFFVCWFFHFTSLHWVLNPASAADLGKILMHTILPTAFYGRDCSPFLKLLILIPLLLKAQSLTHRRVYDSTGEFTNWAAPIP